MTLYAVWEEVRIIYGDVDGKINIMDANLIRRYVAKLITKFPVEG